MGEDRAARQRELARELHRCCGEWKGGAHHEACYLYEPEETPAVIEGQETLI